MLVQLRDLGGENEQERSMGMFYLPQCLKGEMWCSFDGRVGVFLRIEG